MGLRDELDHYDRYLAEARRHLAAGAEPAQTRRSLLRAAKHLDRAANATRDGDIREARQAQARRLHALARSLRDHPAMRAPAATVPAPSRNGQDTTGFATTERPQTRLADIAGHTGLITFLRQRVLAPLQRPDLAAHYGLAPGTGLLLFGPPGTGKTLIARALAGEVGAPLFVVRPSDVLSRYVGESEQQLEQLFAQARAHELALIFFDELEALAPDREQASDSSGVLGRLVPQLLQELDGLSTKDADRLLVVAATNQPWRLDPALLRPGRFDHRVLVDLPDEAALAELIRLHLRGLPHADIDLPFEARTCLGMSGADIRALVDAARLRPFTEALDGQPPRPIGPADLAAARRQVAPSVSAQVAARYRTLAGTSAASATPHATGPKP